MRNIILHQRKERDRIVCGVRDTMEKFYGRGGGGLRTRVKKPVESPWDGGEKVNR